MSDPIHAPAIRRCPTVSWCRNIVEDQSAPHTVHTRDLGTIDATTRPNDVVGVFALQFENDGVLAEPVIRVLYGPDEDRPSCVDIPADAARALGVVVDSLTITSYTEFATALTRGANMLDREVGR